MFHVEHSRAVIIYNPAAGRGLHLNPRSMSRAAKALKKIARQVDVKATEPNRRADTLAREALAAGFDLIVVAGGDGTVNEALQALAGSNATLLVLPSGTANVLARETGLPRNPLAAAESAIRFQTREIPLGVVEFSTHRRYFLLMCGVGFDAAAVRGLDRVRKRMLGMGAYFLSALGQFTKRLGRLQATVGGETLDCTLVVASKSRLYGRAARAGARGSSACRRVRHRLLFFGLVPWLPGLFGGGCDAHFAVVSWGSEAASKNARALKRRRLPRLRPNRWRTGRRSARESSHGPGNCPNPPATGIRRAPVLLVP